jgi:uncharacterized damage-inducible protein DinB
MQVADLVRYNHIVRGLYFDSLTKLPWVKVVEPRGLSFDSMRDVLLHLTMVEDRWINYIIAGKFKEWVNPNFDAFQDMEASKKYLQRIQEDTENYLSYLSAEELCREIVIPWGDKPGMHVSVETGLTHMVIEDMIHYGELSAAFWQMGLEAPYIGFWRYKSSK